MGSSRSPYIRRLTPRWSLLRSGWKRTATSPVAKSETARLPCDWKRAPKATTRARRSRRRGAQSAVDEGTVYDHIYVKEAIPEDGDVGEDWDDEQREEPTKRMS